MTGVWAWAENKLATFLLLLLSGSLNKTDEPRIWTGYSKSTGSGDQKQLKGLEAV